MIPKSLRWRLPLSYIGLALLTALALNGLLLATLRVYYAEREHQHLVVNVALISRRIGDLVSLGAPPAGLQAQIGAYAQALQVRVRLLDSAGNVWIDAGPPRPPALPALATPVPPATPDPDRPTPTPHARPAENAAQAAGPEVIAFAPSLTDLAGQRSSQVVSVPLIHPQTGELLGQVELSEGPAYGAQVLASVLQTGVLASLGAVLLAALLGGIMGRRMSAPVLALTKVTARMAAGEMSARARPQTISELDALAGSFNRMADRVQQTVSTLRDFTADAAHELHTPLTALRANLDLAAAAAGDSDSPVRRAQAQAARLAELTTDLLDLSRLEGQADPPVLEPMDLAALVRELSEAYASQAEQADLNFELRLGEASSPILANRAQVERAAGNLVDNAVKFTPAGGTVTAAVRNEAGWAQLVVVDTGIGIPAADLPRLFSRFHRGQNTGSAYRGSGLGLAIVRAILEQHGGRVTVESDPAGTRITLSWPLFST